MKLLRITSPLALLVLVLVPATTHAKTLAIEYPEFYTGGTPISYFGENFKEPDYKPIPPIIVPENTMIISKGKAVTASVQKAEFGKLSQLVDGDKGHEDKSQIALPKGVQWVQIDLGKTYNLHAIHLWHFYSRDMVVFDTVIKSADDGAFTKNVQVIFNNDHDKSSNMEPGKNMEYIEDFKGKVIPVKDIKGRYVRFYSNQSTFNDLNYYIEAEVFGSPLK